MKKLNKKRVIAVSCVSVAALAIGATIAYNQDRLFFDNIFGLAKDTAEFVETFDSPSDWQPCQEVPKEAIATNKNDTPRYARMKYDEYWRVKNSTTSPDDHTTSDLSLTWNDSGVTKKYAEILFQNENDWVLQDGWYYYKQPLNTNESTSSLLKSVRLNCDANFIESSSYSNNGQTVVSNPDDYAGATFHLYVTFQLLGEQLLVRDRLYDYVANQANSTDQGRDFYADVSGTNVVQTHYETVNDEHPVHYYTGGNVDNNFVYFNGTCWRIVRTAENGSTKLIYSGRPYGSSYYPQGYGCSAGGSNTGIDYEQADNSQQYNSRPDSRYDGVWASGYMYDDKYMPVRIPSLTNFDFVFGKDVSWNPLSQEYTLVDTYQRDTSTTTWQDGIAPVANTYHYTCASTTSATCSEVYYIFYINPSNGYNDTAFLLTDGDRYNDARDNAFSNTKNSLIKTRIDNWFANNLTSMQDKFEDVVYCNDRTIASSYINNGGALYSNALPASQPVYYQGYFRLAAMNRPSVNCPNNARDGFTVSSTRGNGKLTYPVGLLTADEMVMAGAPNKRLTSQPYTSTWLNDSFSTTLFWTMTPSIYGVDGSNDRIYGRAYHYAGNGTNTQGISYPTWNTRWTRPVIAVIYDTYIKAGSGTYSDPLTLEW